jgi:malate dehydrogenase
MWQIAEKTKSTVNDVKKIAVWGNHSPTMFPDLSWSSVKGKPTLDLVGKDWYEK